MAWLVGTPDFCRIGGWLWPEWGGDSPGRWRPPVELRAFWECRWTDEGSGARVRPSVGFSPDRRPAFHMAGGHSASASVDGDSLGRARPHGSAERAHSLGLPGAQASCSLHWSPHGALGDRMPFLSSVLAVLCHRRGLSAPLHGSPDCVELFWLPCLRVFQTIRLDLRCN